MQLLCNDLCSCMHCENDSGDEEESVIPCVGDSSENDSDDDVEDDV